MGKLITILKIFWLDMFIPPWRDVEPYENKPTHCLHWVLGWGWFFVGLIFGAFIAPYFLAVWGLESSPYQAYIVTGIATVAGFLVQLLGWYLTVLYMVTYWMITGHSEELLTIA